MYEPKCDSRIKQVDFSVLDMLAMYAAYVVVFFLRGNSREAFHKPFNVGVIAAYFLAVLLSHLILNSFRDTFKRGYFKEFVATLRTVALTTVIVITILYIFKKGQEQSRLQIFLTAAVYLFFSYGVRLWHKSAILKNRRENAPSLLIVTTSVMAETAVSAVTSEIDGDIYRIAGLAVLDADLTGSTVAGVPVVASRDTVLDYACREWVDEVLFELGPGYVRPEEELVAGFLEMGIVTHTKIDRIDDTYKWKRTAEQIGPYTVFTRSIQMASAKQLIAKRIMDIMGGLVGCVLCGIILLFIGPIIYLKSPGPIIYKSTRIGKNGKRFQFYKIRSMCLNADAQKEGLLSENRHKDGLLFKMEWDPRVIGNVELPDGTRKTGIGEFIRRTSLDEFPQFFSVLKGDMSLVGTRPPTEDEWVKYEMHHRARMAVKPGITGMWQVSGRSEITDFEEVVRLDREYIANWSIGLDIKIILKTVKAVITGKGSM